MRKLNCNGLILIIILRVTVSALLIGLLITTTGCGSSGRHSPDQLVSRTGLPAHIFDDPIQEAVEWNFLVYLDGDNNLESMGIVDLNEMEVAGSDKNINILALVDRHPGYDYSNGNWTSTRLYKIVKDRNGLDTQIISELLYDFGELDMSHPDTLRDFVHYCQEKYPAQKTVLTLWDHGGGIYPRSLSRNHTGQEVGVKGICADDTTGFSEWAVLTTDEIATALAEAESKSGKSIDIINMDACLMQMIEVAYELRRVTDYLAGSAADVPGPGNCYDSLVKRLAENPLQSPEDFARTLVDDYYTYYSFTSENTTYSALSLKDEFVTLISKFKTFTEYLTNTLDTPEVREKIFNARKNAVSFNFGQFIDLYDFVDYISDDNSNLNNEVTTAATAVMGALESCTIKYKGTGSYAFGPYGLSIFMPDPQAWALSISNERYRALEFCADTGWDELLNSLMGMTPELLSVRIRWPEHDCDLGIIEPGDDKILSIIEYDETPNGIFSRDCSNGGEESWVLKSAHQKGSYIPVITAWNYSGPVRIVIQTNAGTGSFELNVKKGYYYIINDLQIDMTKGLGVTYHLKVERIAANKE